MTRYAVAIGVVFLVASCHQYWRQAGEFREQLRCGLSVTEVEELANKYGAEEFTATTVRHSEGPMYSAVRNHSSVHLWFGPGGLEWVQQHELVGLTGVRASLRINLCTGERLGNPRLNVVAPSDLKGATVRLNGKTISELSRGEGPRVGVNVGTTLAFGQHEVVVEKAGFVPILRKFVFRPAAFWPEQTIEIEINEGELRAAG